MIAALEIPVSWIGSILVAIAPAIPPIFLVVGPIATLRGLNSYAEVLTVTGIWLTLMGLLFGIFELFYYGVVRFV